ncbi:nucleoside hydrolase [Halostella sp. PRR32]|uniref:nucleoside hydrolase n=1 Tax=Halostella sp. PRR32 TaxID=3098147 RepID=UPI002B1E2F28|nr:nucleoside hydrolase [Halostella sp. PRR32]
MTTDIILDCDPGHDDAIATLLALTAPELSVRAITTVAGNQTLSKTTRNARQVLTLADRTDVPVASGMAEPMVRDLMVADDVHGESGLDGPDLPEPTVDTVDEDGVDLIARTAKQAGSVTLVPTGPLTNVGMLLKRHPEVESHLDEIVLMGGAVGTGNYTPAAEYNILVDPEAADIVFRSDVPVTMIGLDVTRAARVRAETFDRFRKLGSDVGETVAEWLDFFLRFHEDRFGWEGVPIHDACAVAEVMDRDVIETEPMHVAVETDGEHTLGRTVCDRYGVLDAEPNASVGVDIDREAFVDLLLDSVAKY